MKMMLCSDIRLGAVCMENLDVRQSQKWRRDRIERFADLIDRASQNHTSYALFFGELFGRERVPEEVTDGLFRIVRDESGIQVLLFMPEDEYKRISYRNDIPANVHLLNLNTSDSYLDDHIALRVERETVELQLDDNASIFIRQNEKGFFGTECPDGVKMVPSFEPLGFEDASGATFGYALLDWQSETIGNYLVVNDQKYQFRNVELKIQHADDEKEIIRKLNRIMNGFKADTFLRVFISGRSAFGMVLSPDAVAAQCQNRIFYVEVFDNTSMDIDEETFETDISLRSEFVRLALRDGSLSESERNRIISTGWNALGGKEVNKQ